MIEPTTVMRFLAKSWYKAKDRGYFHVGHPDIWSSRFAHEGDSEGEEDSDKEEKAERLKAQKALPYGRKGSTVPLSVKLMDENTRGGWDADGVWDYDVDDSSPSSTPRRGGGGEKKRKRLHDKKKKR